MPTLGILVNLLKNRNKKNIYIKQKESYLQTDNNRIELQALEYSQKAHTSNEVEFTSSLIKEDIADQINIHVATEKYLSNESKYSYTSTHQKGKPENYRFEPHKDILHQTKYSNYSLFKSRYTFPLASDHSWCIPTSLEEYNLQSEKNGIKPADFFSSDTPMSEIIKEMTISMKHGFHNISNDPIITAIVRSENEDIQNLLSEGDSYDSGIGDSLNSNE